MPLLRTSKLHVATALVVAALTGGRASADVDVRTVEVVATGDKVATAAVEALVRELLKRRPVTIRWTRVSEIDPRDVLSRRAADLGLAARVWVDLSDPTGARLFVANATSDHFLVRLVPSDHGDQEVEEEAVAQIVGSAVDAILAGGEIGVAREVAARQMAVAPSVAPPVEETPPPSVRRFAPGGAVTGEIGAFVGLRALGAGPALDVEPGIVAGLGGPKRWPVRPLLLLELDYEAPVDWQAEAVAVRLEGGGGSLQPGLEARLGRRVAIRASAGLGADAIHVQPRAPRGSSFEAGPPFWLAAMIATVRAGVEVDVFTRLTLFASGGFDADLSGIRFNVTEAGATEPNVVPWRVWPVTRLGASLRFDGGGSP